MKNTLLRCAFVAAVAVGLLLPAGSAAAGELKLSMQNGRVTIVADNVPLRQILQEWARIGQTKIVNADKLPGPNVTLQLIDAPEKDALDVLLRSAAGYIAAPRTVPVANAAIYDRVTIMPTSRAPGGHGDQHGGADVPAPAATDRRQRRTDQRGDATAAAAQSRGRPVPGHAAAARHDAAADAARSAPGAADVAAPRRGRAAADAERHPEPVPADPPARHADDDRTRWWSGRQLRPACPPQLQRKEK